MHPATMLIPCLLALAATASGKAPAPSAPAIPIEVTRVGERVLVLDCLDVNVTAVATREGIVVIDTGRSPGLMEAIARRIEREFGRSDFRYVINTHAHPDHNSGNQVFPAAVIISHPAGPAAMRHDRADTPGALRSARAWIARDRALLSAPDADPDQARRARAELPALERMLADLQDHYTATPATIVVHDRLSLDLGDVRFELTACGRAHSTSDLLVHIPGERILLTGDLFCGPENPCFAVSPLVDVPCLAAGIERALDDPAGLETVIPGHGGLLTRADLVRLLGMMRERYAAFASRRSAAATLDTLIAGMGIDRALERLTALEGAGEDSAYFSAEEFDLLGRSYRSMGRLPEAIRILAFADSLSPGSPLLLNSLGGALEEAGDVPAAISCYERSLALSPENRSIADRLMRLRARKARDSSARP